MLIVISGKAQVGKDTLGNYLINEFYKNYGFVFRRNAYANLLKKMVQYDFCLSDDQLWGNGKECMTKYYKRKDGFSSNPSDYWTPREIMQEYGSFYRSINKDFWVEKLLFEIEDEGNPHTIITDGRYPNEILPVLERGGFHIHINRKKEDEIHCPQHESETSLDNVDIKINFEVDNNGTLDDLRNKATNIASRIMEIHK